MMPSPSFLVTGVSDDAVRAFLVEFDPHGFLCSYVAYHHYHDPHVPLIAHLGGALTLLSAMIPSAGNMFLGGRHVKSQLTTLLTGDGGIGAYNSVSRDMRELGIAASRPVNTLSYQTRPTELAGMLETDPDVVFLLGDTPWLYDASRLTQAQANWREALTARITDMGEGRGVPLVANRVPRPAFFGVYTAGSAVDHARDSWGSPIVGEGLSLACASADTRALVQPTFTWHQGGTVWDFHSGPARLGAALTARRQLLERSRIAGGVDDDPQASEHAINAARSTLVQPEMAFGQPLPPSQGHMNRLSGCARLLPGLLYALGACFAYEDHHRRVMQGPMAAWGLGPHYRARAARVLGWHAATMREVSLLVPPTATERLRQRILRLITYKTGERRSVISRALRDIPPSVLDEALQGMTGVWIHANIDRTDPGDLVYTRIPESKVTAPEEAPVPPATAHGMGSVVSASFTETPIAPDDYDD